MNFTKQDVEDFLIGENKNKYFLRFKTKSDYLEAFIYLKNPNKNIDHVELASYRIDDFSFVLVSKNEKFGGFKSDLTLLWRHHIKNIDNDDNSKNDDFYIGT